MFQFDYVQILYSYNLRFPISTDPVKTDTLSTLQTQINAFIENYEDDKVTLLILIHA